MEGVRIDGGGARREVDNYGNGGASEGGAAGTRERREGRLGATGSLGRRKG